MRTRARVVPGDGGLVARARASSASTAVRSPRSASPTSRTTTSTTTAPSTRTSRRRPRCSPGRFSAAATVNVDDEHGRRSPLAPACSWRHDGASPSGWRPAPTPTWRARGVVLGATATAFLARRSPDGGRRRRSRSPLLGAFNVAEHVCGGSAPPSPPASRSQRWSKVSGTASWCPAAWSRSTAAALHRARRLRAHPRRPGPGARRGPRDHHRRRRRRLGSSWCSAAAAIATPPSAR